MQLPIPDDVRTPIQHGPLVHSNPHRQIVPQTFRSEADILHSGHEIRHTDVYTNCPIL